MKRSVLGILSIATASPCVAQQAYEIQFDSPAESLAYLRGVDGAVIEENEGWIVVSIQEGNETSNWTFAPEGHPAYPGVVKVTLYGDAEPQNVAIDFLCDTPIDACDAFMQERIFGRVGRRIVTPENAEALEFDVELLPAGGAYLYRLRVEFPKVRANGYRYSYTNVELTTDEGTVLLWRVESYDVSGSSDRSFFTLAGSKEWLACLTLNSGFNAASVPQESNAELESYNSFRILPSVFLEAAGEITSSATQLCAELKLGG